MVTKNNIEKINEINKINKINIDKELLSKELIKENKNLLNLMNKLNPVSLILYGSYSYNKQTVNSDIDLMIILKKNIFSNNEIDDYFIDLKKQISKIFNKPVDIVVMIKTNKIQYCEEFSDPDTNFILNVYNDAYYLYGINDKDNILESIKYKKF